MRESISKNYEYYAPMEFKDQKHRDKFLSLSNEEQIRLSKLHMEEVNKKRKSFYDELSASRERMAKEHADIRIKRVGF